MRHFYLRSFFEQCTLIVVTAMLAGCGGGGGSSNAPPQSYSIGVTVSIGSASGLVLQNNAGDDLTVSADGSFTFASQVISGGSYSVTVKTQPTNPLETCTVANGSGVVGNSNVIGVSVSCSVNFYSVRGTVSGLLGSNLTLRLNGVGQLPITGNGTFDFAAGICCGNSYSVTVASQPVMPDQACVVSNGSGTVTNADIANVMVVCTNSYTVGGSVSGLFGSGMILSNNSADNLSVLSNGIFTFGTRVPTGGAYNVAVVTQPTIPSQTCVVSNGVGNVGGADITAVQVTCSTNAFTVGGAVSGLTGPGLALRINGAGDLAISANGAFTFGAALQSGTTYSVSVAAQPTGRNQHCNVTSGDGAVTTANVSSVVVSCHAILGIAYVANETANSVSVYSISAADGALNEVAGSPFTTSTDPVFVTADRNGRFVFVAHYSGQKISAYTVDGAYRLVEIAGSPYSASNGIVSLALTPNGSYLYGVDSGFQQILAYTVDAASGALMPVVGGPFPSFGNPRSIAIDPAGTFAYVANRFGGVTGYTIDSGTGSLTPVPGSPFAAGTEPWVVTVHPTGTRTYVGNSASADISAYSIDSATGTLTGIAGSPFASVVGACSMAWEPSGKFLYECTSGEIDAYTISAASGVPTLIPGSPFAVGIAPTSLAIDPTGKYLYVASQSDTVMAYKIDNLSGSLSFIANGSVATGTFPISIAVSN